MGDGVLLVRQAVKIHVGVIHRGVQRPVPGVVGVGQAGDLGDVGAVGQLQTPGSAEHSLTIRAYPKTTPLGECGGGKAPSAGPSAEGWGCPPASFPSPAPLARERGAEEVRVFGQVLSGAGEGAAPHKRGGPKRFSQGDIAT